MSDHFTTSQSKGLNIVYTYLEVKLKFLSFKIKRIEIGLPQILAHIIEYYDQNKNQ